jgi:hypothetical protein
MRRRERSLWRRLFFPHELEPTPGTEQVSQGVAIRVEAVAHYLRVERRTAWGPASSLGKMKLFEDGPVPSDGSFGNQESIVRPLRETSTISRCAACNGAGTLRCHVCNGSGGRYTLWCSTCSGSGREPHSECNGEGERASWKEVVYTRSTASLVRWSIPEEFATHEVRQAVERSAAPSPAFLIKDLSDARIAPLLRGTSEGPFTCIASARAAAEELEKQLCESEREGIRITASFQVAPVSAVTFRGALNREERFWLVGRGPAAVEPEDPPSRVRWPALRYLRYFGSLLVAIGETGYWPFQLGVWGLLYYVLRYSRFARRTFGFSALDIHPLYSFSSAVIAAALAHDLVRGGLLKRFLDSVRLSYRRLRRRTRVRTIAVVGAPDDFRTWLACLNMIGSHLDRLKPVGPATRELLRAMLGQAPGSNSCPTTFLETKQGEVLRLVPVGLPSSKSRYESSLISGAVDGVIRLTRMSDDNTAADVTCPQASLVLSRRTDLADSTGATPTGAAAIDLIRKSFTRETTAGLDWQAVFNRLWAPVEHVLSFAGRPDSPRKLPHMYDIMTADPPASIAPTSRARSLVHP